MALNAAQVRDGWRALVSADPALGSTMSKAELAAAVSAVDAWVTANQASFVAALPEPFKSNSSAAQKALLLIHVAMKRAGL